MVIWCVTLLLLGALVYLNLIGVPGFIRRPLLAELQERGVDLRFADLRLHWVRGFVAEKVQFGTSAVVTNPTLPHLKAREVELNMDWRKLFSGRLQVDTLAVREGRLEWTLMDSSTPAAPLTVDKIETRLRFLPGDLWMLDELRGQFAGANFSLSGCFTNASAIRDWQVERPETKYDAMLWSRRLRNLADVLQQISFSSPPDLRLNVNGDGRNPRSFDARMTLRAQDANTPWGRALAVALMAQVKPDASNDIPRTEISLVAREVQTPWVSSTNLDFKLRLQTTPEHPGQVASVATLRSAIVATPWATLTRPQVKMYLDYELEHPIPRGGRVEFHAESLAAWLTRSAAVDLSAEWATVTNQFVADPSLGFWTNLAPYHVKWSGALSSLRTLALLADQFECSGEWSAPELLITKFNSELYHGGISATGRLDVVTRQAAGAGSADFEFKRIAPLLGPEAQEWLASISWASPPKLQCAATATLPPWTSPGSDWISEVHPTMKLAGFVAVTNGAYRGIHADWMTTHFSCTNLTWELPDLQLGRPEGSLAMFHQANDATRDYYFRFRSSVDLRSVAPLLDSHVREELDSCELTQPPVVEGELWGRWSDHERIGFRGRVAVTNAAFRNQVVDAALAQVEYTNRVLRLVEPRVYHGAQHMAAPGIAADFNGLRVYITNATGTYDPAAITHAIGPVVAHAMLPYHFITAPTAVVDGYVSMHDPLDANITFAGGGDCFEALNFRATNYQARINWHNNLLTVTNAVGGFYDGAASGWAQFVFTDHEHATYAFSIDVTNAHLTTLVSAITQKTNNLEGRLTGQLSVTNASTESLNSWNGFGRAELREGLLWELPIFGVLSKPLDAIMPGVGNSRFTGATATFSITDGIFYSPDLEMRSPTMRLQYRGAVSFENVIDARVTAEPLRDTPLVGSVVSTVLAPVAHLFAYRITGTLEHPKSEPIYIPGPMMYLFSPFQSLGDLFTTSPSIAPAPVPETKPGQPKS